MGLARLRQQRFTASLNDCTPLINGSDCQSYYDLCEDTKNYESKWRPPSRRQHQFSSMYQRILLPWQYQSTFGLQTLPVFGEQTLYHGGGYALNLGRTLNNTLAILAYMRRTHWLDHNTRVVFIELTLYSANVNQFNVITIVCERTPFGTYAVRPHIQTAKLLFILENQRPIAVVVFVLFVLITIAYLFRLLLKLLQSQLRTFFQIIWNDVDILIVSFSIGAVYLFFVRSKYVVGLLRLVQDTRNNEFVSFYWAAAADDWLTWWTGVLVCMATVRFWKICQFSLVCRMISEALWMARGRLIGITAVLLIILVALSVWVHAVCGAEPIFATYARTFTSLLAMSCGFVEELHATALVQGGGKWFSIVVYTLLMVAMNFYLLNMFVTIVCLDFSEKRDELRGCQSVKLRFIDFIKMEWGLFGGGDAGQPKEIVDVKVAMERDKKRLIVLQSQIHIVDRYLRAIIEKKNDGKLVFVNKR